MMSRAQRLRATYTDNLRNIARDCSPRFIVSPLLFSPRGFYMCRRRSRPGTLRERARKELQFVDEMARYCREVLLLELE